MERFLNGCSSHEQCTVSFITKRIPSARVPYKPLKLMNSWTHRGCSILLSNKTSTFQISSPIFENVRSQYFHQHAHNHVFRVPSQAEKKTPSIIFPSYQLFQCLAGCGHVKEPSKSFFFSSVSMISRISACILVSSSCPWWFQCVETKKKAYAWFSPKDLATEHQNISKHLSFQHTPRFTRTPSQKKNWKMDEAILSFWGVFAYFHGAMLILGGG